MTQAEALAILKTGANVFLTGEPGSGKSYTVNAYVHYLRERGIEPSITASTGIAATHIHGMTIHAWSGIGISNFLTPADLDRITTKEHVVRRIRPAKVLIIDEISMLSKETLDMVEAVVREVKQSPLVFGGLQVIYVGDFFQLPPVVRRLWQDEREDQFYPDEEQSIFSFTSHAWRRSNPLICYLTEQHRQDDGVYTDVLKAVRGNSITSVHHGYLKKRILKQSDDSRDITKLFSHNADVDRINADALATLEGSPKIFTMRTQGRENLVETLKRGCLSPEILHLKVGASVMFTKNNTQAGFVNGTLGVVDRFMATTGYPQIRTYDHRLIVAEPLEWGIEDNGKKLATISQMPLRLAWAMTVHKSQGMSLDAAIIDLSQAFEYGQGYVALSRVRRMSGLHLLGLNKRALEVHPEIFEKDSEFREQSEVAAETFASMGAHDLEVLHANFIQACGGSSTAGAVKAKSNKKAQTKSKKVASPEYTEKMKVMRAQYPRAYTPWTGDDDQLLTVSFTKEKNEQKLSNILQRQPSAIHARLIKLELIADDYVKKLPP